MADAINDTKSNTASDFVTKYLNAKILGYLGLVGIFLASILIILYFKKFTIIFDAIAFFEISNLSNFIITLLKCYSLTDLIALSGAVVGIIVAYLYFWHTISTVYNDPERTGSNQLTAFQLINSIASNSVWLIILLLYLWLVEANYYEIGAVFVVVAILGWFGYAILVSYEKLLLNFDALVELGDFINKPDKTTNSKPFFSKNILNLFDLRKNSADTVFLLTITSLIFGIVFSFNILSIITIELFLIRYFINTAYTNIIPRRLSLTLKADIDSKKSFETFVIREYPSFYQCLVKGESQDSTELVMKDSIEKMTIVV